MPWQRLVADTACELLPDGRPAYREVIVTVPRQSGKTALFFSWQLDRCMSWGRPQRTAFTAQTGKDARDKFLDELFPLLDQSPLNALVKRANRGMGNESIQFRNGSSLRILSTSSTTGHGKTLHQAVMDEVWHDVDDRREQGLRPAMITQADAQLLVCSTAGTAASTLYNRKVRAGREAAKLDTGKGIAYFEWSAPADWTVDQVHRLGEFHPAVGFTQTEDALAVELASMEPDEALRAYGNRPTQGTDSIWPDETWARVCSATAEPTGTLRIAAEVAEDRSTSCLVVADGDTCELVERRGGTDWLVGRAEELRDRHRGRIVIDGRGPASTLGWDKRVTRMDSEDVVTACAELWDMVVEGRVTFRACEEFDRAVRGAVKRRVGDRWVWSRSGSHDDVTPLMAASLALHAGRKGAAPWVAFG